MIDVGSFPAVAAEGGVSRRSFLRASFGLPMALSNFPLFASDALGHGKAKSVILLWLWGGPSHLDTFDPKPDAPAEIRGPFQATKTPSCGCVWSMPKPPPWPPPVTRQGRHGGAVVTVVQPVKSPVSKLPLISNSLGAVGCAAAPGPGGKRSGSPGSP